MSFPKKLVSLLFVGCLFLAQDSNSNNPPVYQAQAGKQPTTVQAPQQQTPPVFGSSNQQQLANSFLEYYTRQGTPLFKGNESFLFQSNGKTLKKKSIDVKDQKKCVLIFFGEWCPHCHAFLTKFSKNIDLLRLTGITVIFIAIPSIEKLKHWQEPDIDDFNAAENKISSYGIKLVHDRVFVTMIGERSILATCGIEGLPVIVAVENGIEKFRDVGESAVQKMDFSNQETFKQFLEIWDNNKKESEKVDTQSLNETPKEEQEEETSKKIEKTKKQRYKTKKRNSSIFKEKLAEKHGRTHEGKTKVDRKKARYFTESLNFYSRDLNRG
ncbi:MAG: redoxin domain-containing protein [Holosporales bacterium]|jgi:thiol-disulfide isomerase/thioredoxin|nr:redoxin domain-containing protein [Holosporales bacterium]